ALEGDALRARGVGRPAHRVVDDVGAVATGGLLDRGDDVLGPAVDDDVAPCLAGDRDLLRAADDAVHVRARGPAELDRGPPEATGGGVDEEVLPFAQPRPAVQGEPAGLVADHQGGAGRVVEAVGGGEGRGRVHEALGGEAAGR